MGDSRFEAPLARLRQATDARAALHALADEDVIAALGASARTNDPYWANVLATEALNRTRRQAAVAAHIGDGVIALDANGRVTFANPAAGDLLGVEPRLLLGKPVTAAVHADEDCIDCPVARQGAHEPMRGEHVLARRDGSLFAASYTLAPIAPDGLAIGAVIAFRDETTAKQATAELATRRARLALLGETAQLLLASEDPHAIIDGIFAKLAEHLGLELYANYLVHEEGRYMRLGAYRGFPEEAMERFRWIPFGTAVSGTVAQRREQIIVEDVQAREDEMTEAIRSLGITAYACHPLIAHGRLMGTLSFGTRGRTAFTEDEVALMQTVAFHVALALEHGEGTKS